MFCTNCGSQLQDGASFCINCGARMSAVTPPPPATSAPVPQRRAQSFLTPLPGDNVPTPLAGHPEKCPWCGAPIEDRCGAPIEDRHGAPIEDRHGALIEDRSGSPATCPRCGAALQTRSTPSRSGWLELPPRKDMAKLQFGNSSCQIEGLYVPIADMNLAAEDSVYFSHHVLLWMDPRVHITAMSMRGGWKRMFAGLPLIMTVAQGPGHIAFSKDEPGELIALPLQPGQAVDVREHMFLVATSNIEYDWFQSQIWYGMRNGKDTETHYPLGMFMDRFSSPARPGLLLLHAGGSVLVRQLAPNQTILVKPTALIFKDPSVDMQLHFEHPNAGVFGWGSWTHRSIWLRLVGPGRVAIQSVFERVEQEGGNLVSYSNATFQQW